MEDSSEGQDVTQLFNKNHTLFWLPIAAVLVTFFVVQQLDKSSVQTEPSDPISVSTNSVPTAKFIESSVSKGIAFKHEHRAAEIAGLKDTFGSGVCALDFNNDGFEDLFIVGGKGQTRRYGKQHWWNQKQGSKLYQNVGGSYFTDATEKLSQSQIIEGYGCAVGDFNQDGFADLVLTQQGQLTIFSNDGTPTFHAITIPLKNSQTWPLSATVWDGNNDGIDDLIISNFAEFSNDLKVGAQEYGYQRHSQFDTRNYSGQQNQILLSPEKGFSPQNTGNLESLDSFDRTLSIVPISQLSGAQHIDSQESGLYVANAAGSNSYVQNGDSIASLYKPNFLRKLLQTIKTPIVQASQIHWAGSPSVILTQHEFGGTQLYDLGAQSKADLSWNTQLNTDLDNATQSWATLISDLNNDGIEDVVFSRGFTSRHIDSPYKPQGSLNTVKLQTESGQFDSQNATLLPALKRSSRGAALADFNNDGLIDIAFNNNNGFFSLYVNHSPTRNWVSFACTPMFACEGSTWHLTYELANVTQKRSKTALYSKPQPFLSSNQKRVHFAFYAPPQNLTLNVSLKNGKQLSFAKLERNKIHAVNVNSASLKIVNQSHHLRASETPSLASLVNAGHSQLFGYLAQRPHISNDELIQLTQYLIDYKLNNKHLSVSNTPVIQVLTSWVIEQAMLNNPQFSPPPLMANIIRLMGGTESSLYVDYMEVLIARLSHSNFCALTQELNYWFWEEEVAPKTKQLLKAPLVHKVLNSDSIDVIECGLHALAASEDPTIGESLLPLLAQQKSSDQRRTTASTIRALGFLKYTKSTEHVRSTCEKASDAIIKAECLVTLSKFGFDFQHFNMTISADDRNVFALHEDRVIIDNLAFSRTAAEQNTHKSALTEYEHSALTSHAQLAHLYALSSASTATKKRLALAQADTLPDAQQSHLAIRWHQVYRTTIDDYADTWIELGSKADWLLPYFSSKVLAQLINQVGRQELPIKTAYEVAYQCSIRPTLRALCDEQLSIQPTLSQAQLEEALATFPQGVTYVLMSSNQVSKNILIQKLYQLNKQWIQPLATEQKHLEYVSQLLRLNSNYRSIPPVQVDANWLEKFIQNAVQNNATLNKQWLLQHQHLMTQQTQAYAQMIGI
ncbi:FG-GAP repeat domain-containing protein [Echinimonas agarilytica]|uniref:VCBS repeat-containing protein n=1 Tax=Echinimonas agarilytica TaxID=1215918 RepID=A0AA41W5L1_9GAMM|nr:VCBS repeat-containing protein [Echinimonas agarilytica]MCM2679176.1 VCBS repeat-containing protein [Echinimonas agarilytica]